MTPIRPEDLARQLAGLSEEQLRQVADFVAFLRYSSRRAVLAPMEQRIADLYSDFSERDRALANAGLSDFRDMLSDEDAG